MIALRIYTLTAALLVAGIALPQWRRWQTFMPENQLGWLAVVGFNLAAIVGTLRGLFEHLPASYATWTQSSAVTFALIAALYRPWIWARLRAAGARRRHGSP